jgi:hypothetical protein
VSTKREPGKVTSRLAVGAPAASYAVAVHERVEVCHPIGGPMFIKSVWDEARPNLDERLGARIRQNTRLK